MINKPVVAFPHKISGIGGPSSFQERIEKQLLSKGWEIVYFDQGFDCKPDVIFVVNGTRRLVSLIYWKLNGVKILLRVDGLEWQHKQERVGVRKWMYCELLNLLVLFLRNILADHVVYQSNFIEKWWGEKYGEANVESTIILNGVDTNQFAPTDSCLENEIDEVLCVEGGVNSKPAYKILSELSLWPITVIGRYDPKRVIELSLGNVRFVGPVPRESIPGFMKGRKVFLNLETIPPCPNSAIEALSSGLPVVGFNTGSLKEIVGNNAGILPNYPGNPWKLDPPETAELAVAIQRVFDNFDEFAAAARLRALQLFSIEKMSTEYIGILNKLVRR
jgi:glycosyltransferase involved in cell wall biosynthesis